MNEQSEFNGFILGVIMCSFIRLFFVGFDNVIRLDHKALLEHLDSCNRIGSSIEKVYRDLDLKCVNHANFYFYK